MDSREQLGTQNLLVIRPSPTWAPLRLRELWDYRELIYFLVWRDVKVRYKQTALGVGWVVLQPFMIMVVFSVFFGRLAGVPSDGLPYPVFAFCALLPWQLFLRALTESGNSLVANERLVTKVYFPRLIIPLSAVLGGLVDFSLAFLVFFGITGYYGIVPTPAVLALPFLIVLTLVAALSVSLWLSALNVKYRDVRYTIPFLTQLWLFMSPVAYPTSLIPETWRLVYALNPMVGVIEGFRWALLGTNTGLSLVSVSAAVVVFLLAGGLYYFRRMEKTFADLI